MRSFFTVFKYSDFSFNANTFNTFTCDETRSLAAVIGLEFKIFTLLFPKSSNKSFFTNSLLKLLASLLNESVLLSAKGFLERFQSTILVMHPGFKLMILNGSWANAFTLAPMCIYPSRALSLLLTRLSNKLVI